jgi:gliding motility-associated-like protein
MWGFQESHSGTGYGHIISYYSFVSPEYREYLQTELACPLRAGETYHVSFFVSCSDNSGFSIDGMGLHFSADPIISNNIVVINLGGPPSISNPTGSILSNKTGWREITGTYLATGGEKFITIGNFKSDDDLAIDDLPGNLSFYASYYIDDISVTPENSWLDLGNDTVVCFGESIWVDASLGCQGHYLWNDGDTNALRQLDAPGIYSVTASLGCGPVSDQIRFDWQPFPDAALPSDTFLCPGGSVTLEAGEGFDQYVWNDGSGGKLLTIAQPGFYWIEVTDAAGCTGRDTSFVSLLPEPMVDFGDDTELCNWDSALLDPGNEGIYASYTWQDQSDNDYYWVKLPGKYWVDVVNPCGKATDTVIFTFKDCQTQLWVPNAFTPDNGGTNSLFMAQGLNIAAFRMYIYNRWGEMVFESSDLNMGWNGTFAGRPCPSGVYVWIIRYKGISESDQNDQVRKGNVVLIR